MKKFNNSIKWMALIGICVMVFVLAACAQKPTEAASGEAAKPSNPGGPGEAINLTGDPVKGAAIFATTCVACHGPEGKGGVANPGTDDKTVPPLNPIDSSMVSKDAKTFATNIDLFIEHGSKPEGDAPTLSMLPLGDNKTLKPQEIADVIAYVISLNK